MSLHPVSFLRSLSREFDVFSSSPEPDAGLLALDLYPPLPVAGTRLVWGFRIADTAVRSGKSHLACVDVSGTVTDLLEIALKLEDRRGSYSWEERAAVFTLLKNGGDREYRERIDRLVVPSGSFVPQMEKYLELSGALKSMVRDGKLDLKAAVGLSGLPDDAVGLFAPPDLRLSYSERRMIMQMLLEIMKRDGLSAARTVELAASILEAKEPADAARRLRMPGYSSLSDSLDTLRGSCLRGSGVNLEPPPMFEGSSFGVSFGFASSRQLAVRIAALNKLLDRCDELFELLR